MNIDALSTINSKFREAVRIANVINLQGESA